MHSYDYNESRLELFKEALNSVKENCPELDLDKYFMICDKLEIALIELRNKQISEFNERKEEGKYEKRIQVSHLRIERDLSITQVATGKKSKLHHGMVRFLHRSDNEKAGNTKANFLKEINEKYTSYRENANLEKLKAEEERKKEKEKEKEREKELKNKKKNKYSELSQSQTKSTSSDTSTELKENKEAEAKKLKKEKEMKHKQNLKDKSINLN